MDHFGDAPKGDSRLALGHLQEPRDLVPGHHQSWQPPHPWIPRYSSRCPPMQGQCRQERGQKGDSGLPGQRRWAILSRP